MANLLQYVRKASSLAKLVVLFIAYVVLLSLGGLYHEVRSFSGRVANRVSPGQAGVSGGDAVGPQKSD
jgi:hypothetical protein